MQTWTEIDAWRRATRPDLLARRMAVPQDERRRVETALHGAIRDLFPELRKETIGFYWPIKGEINLVPLVVDCLTHGATAALPVVVQKRQPLVFWRWRPGMKLGRGFWNIPVPPAPDQLHPTVLLVPLLGFDAAGYRLGYGGGYYDRTLAAMTKRPVTIGVGYELGRLETIHPQAHDMPLDAIVTEAGATRFRDRGVSLQRVAHAVASEHGFASPPCFMHELDPE